MTTVPNATVKTAIRIWLIGSLSVIVAIVPWVGSSEPEIVAPVKIDWGANEFSDLSGVGVVGKYLVVANDEAKHSVHVLESRDGGYKYFDKVRLSTEDTELDLEGVACDSNIVYVVGSHSRNKNNEREKAREKVYRFELGPDGKLKGDIKVISLRKVIDEHPSLEPATHLKPKEGGIDIEGIAVKDGWIFAGFRGPLDHSDALVLKFKFEDASSTAQLIPVDLGGLGIRDLTSVKDGFLILAGPMHDGAGPYQLHHWNGAAGPAGKSQRMCTIPTKVGAKAEGFAILRDDITACEFLIFYDGPKGGDPTRFRLAK